MSLRIAVVIHGGSEGLILTVLFGIHSSVRSFNLLVMLQAWVLTSSSYSESQSVLATLVLKEA